MNSFEQDIALARQIAQRVKDIGGRAMLVGGFVRDSLLGIESKDVDLEIYGVAPSALKTLLSALGTVMEKEACVGVYGLAHSGLNISLPRRKRRAGDRSTDFDVNVDPNMSFETATMRRDFAINAMMRDALTGELVDLWGGQADLDRRLIRHVNDVTFREDALRVFRAARFAARLDARIDPDTLALCRDMDVTGLSVERVFDELSTALLKAKKPSVFFRALREMGHLEEYFPELESCVGVPQNPAYHPEGDVFEHTMLVLDCAAGLRARAKRPLAFMLSALTHDLGKVVATEVGPDGKITSYGHEVAGLPLCERQLRRLTDREDLVEYAKNMMWLHMRPNILAKCRSKKKKTRQLFDLSVCPEDLILLSRADASGKAGEPYDETNEAFLLERLEDYRRVVRLPMVTEEDLRSAGLASGEDLTRWLDRARQLHFAGLDRKHALKQVMAEAAGSRTQSR